MLSVRISSYGCTREVWGARGKRKRASLAASSLLGRLEYLPFLSGRVMIDFIVISGGLLWDLKAQSKRHSIRAPNLT